MYKSKTPRKSLEIELRKENGKRLLHFAEAPLSGFNNALWTDIGSEELFIAVERLMISNRVAHNVSLIQPITNSKFTVVYNGL